MNSQTFEREGREPKQNSEVINIALVHHEQTAATAAERLTRSIVGRSIRDADIHVDRFGFDDLEHVTCAAEAMELAASAEIFIIASCGAKGLPARVKDWLKRSIDRRAGHATLIICLVGSRDGKARGGSTVDFLTDAARGGGHDFLISGFVTPCLSARSSEPPWPAAWEHWGLNE